jgi:hypothetical protein
MQSAEDFLNKETKGSEMTTAITTSQGNAIMQPQVNNAWESPKMLVERIKHMQTVKKNLMVEGKHFGTIQGCDKPSLWQEGAQIMCVAFKVAPRMAPGYPERIEEDGHVRYIVMQEFYDFNGIYLGNGIGECSTAEEKYAWRRSVCDEEYEEADEDRRRIKYGKTKAGSVYKIKQVRTNPADVANTVLKMAKKRSLVNGILDTTAASSIFTQDVEDLSGVMDFDHENRPESTKPKVEPPQVVLPASGKTISEAQAKRLYAICKKAGTDIEQLKAYLKAKRGYEHLTDIPMGQAYDFICEKAEKEPGFFAPDAAGEDLTEKVTDKLTILKAAAIGAGKNLEDHLVAEFSFGVKEALSAPDDLFSTILESFNV